MKTNSIKQSGWVHIEPSRCEPCKTPDPIHPLSSSWVCPVCTTEYQVCRINGKNFMSPNRILWIDSKYNKSNK